MFWKAVSMWVTAAVLMIAALWLVTRRYEGDGPAETEPASPPSSKVEAGPVLRTKPAPVTGVVEAGEGARHTSRGWRVSYRIRASHGEPVRVREVWFINTDSGRMFRLDGNDDLASGAGDVVGAGYVYAKTYTGIGYAVSKRVERPLEGERHVMLQALSPADLLEASGAVVAPADIASPYGNTLVTATAVHPALAFMDHEQRVVTRTAGLFEILLPAGTWRLVATRGRSWASDPVEVEAGTTRVHLLLRDRARRVVIIDELTEQTPVSSHVVLERRHERGPRRMRTWRNTQPTPEREALTVACRDERQAVRVRAEGYEDSAWVELAEYPEAATVTVALRRK